MNSELQTFPLKSPPASTSMICAALMILPIGSFFILKGVAPRMMGLHVFLYGGILALLVFLLFSLRKTRFEISAKGLQIRGDMWGRLLPWNELDVANARLVSFEVEPGLKPKWKTCGTALPGYASGWFRLYNKSKALLFLTDKREAIYLPTRKDFSVLLSSTDNPALLQALQQGGKTRG